MSNRRGGARQVARRRGPRPDRGLPGLRHRRTLARIAAVTVLVASGGCYALDVTAGEGRILWRRRAIEDVLADPGLDADRRAKLELVLDVRGFAIEALGLSETGSYTSYSDVGDAPVAWNVSASAPDALDPHVWWFPLIGRLPYKGFFDRALAEAEAARLEQVGLDVVLGAVPAFSTLGWFDDPVVPSMLAQDRAEVAELVIHEMTHATLWADGDGALNESIATFVGIHGALAYFAGQGDAGAEDRRRVGTNRRDAALFAGAVAGLRRRLERIYGASGSRAAKLERKAEAFRAFRRDFARDVYPQLAEPDAYSFVAAPAMKLDNAFVLGFDRYHGELDELEALLAREGCIRAAIEALRAIVQAGDPRAALATAIGSAAATSDAARWPGPQ